MTDPTYPLPSMLQTTLSITAFFLPLMLYAVWSALAFSDLGRRTDIGAGARVGWIAAILLLPWIGAALYHLIGRSTVPGSVRTAMLAGGAAAYGLVLLAGKALGGIS